MVDFLLGVLWETWNIFKQASIFLLFGFLLAGVLAVLVPEKALSKLFRTGKIKSVLWASAIGAPLPLCSCGVVPAALGLRKQGATPGATAAFLIATPETGVDSISLRYALMDPIMTVVRPIAAVTTAVTAGIWINLFGTRKTVAEQQSETQPVVAEAESQVGSQHDATHAHDHSHTHDHSHDAVPGPQENGLGIGTPAGRVRRTAMRIYH